MHPPLIGATGTGRRTSGTDPAWRNDFDLAGPAGNGKTPP